MPRLDATQLEATKATSPALTGPDLIRRDTTRPDTTSGRIDTTFCDCRNHEKGSANSAVYPPERPLVPAEAHDISARAGQANEARADRVGDHSGKRCPLPDA